MMDGVDELPTAFERRLRGVAAIARRILTVPKLKSSVR
jgi:hypothetical protein